MCYVTLATPDVASAVNLPVEEYRSLRASEKQQRKQAVEIKTRSHNPHDVWNINKCTQLHY